MNYFELLKIQAEKYHEKTFLILDDREYSYEEIFERSIELSRQLNDVHGVQLISDGGFLGQLLLFFAVQGAGGVPVILHGGLSQEGAARLAEKNPVQGLVQLENGKILYEAFDSNVTKNQKTAEDMTDVCMGALSSGSTGLPKLLYRSYESWGDFFPVQNKIFGVDETSRFFLQGSLGFTGNLNFLMSILYAGSAAITSDKIMVKTWGRLMKDYGADVLYLVPSKLRLLMAGYNGQLDSVKKILAGSQLLSKKDLRDIKENFKNARLILYYGASELSYITYVDSVKMNKNPGDLGVTFPGISVSIGEDSLIYVDTPYGVKGSPRPCTVGDTGEIDERGHLLFYGRSQDWVNKCGYKISCTKIENILLEIPGVEDAAVISAEDELRGQELAAFIVLDDRTSEEYARKSLKQRLSNVEIPGYVYFISEIPLNDRGKHDRSSLLKYCVRK